MALEGIATMPVAGPRLGQGEGRLARLDLQVRRGWTGHFVPHLVVMVCPDYGLAGLQRTRLSSANLRVISGHWPSGDASMTKRLALHAELVPLAYAEALLELAASLAVPRERLLAAAGVSLPVLHNPTGRLSLADFH